MMKQKVIGTKGATQTQNQAWDLRGNYMMRKINVSLAHRRKLCFGKKNQVAQLKFGHDNDIADQARNDVMEYHSNENSQEVVQ